MSEYEESDIMSFKTMAQHFTKKKKLSKIKKKIKILIENISNIMKRESIVKKKIHFKIITADFSKKIKLSS